MSRPWVVSCCSGCPFSGRIGESWGCWLNHNLAARMADPEPPRRCPLRNGDVPVRLRSKDGGK